MRAVDTFRDVRDAAEKAMFPTGTLSRSLKKTEPELQQGASGMSHKQQLKVVRCIGLSRQIPGRRPVPYTPRAQRAYSSPVSGEHGPLRSLRRRVCSSRTDDLNGQKRRRISSVVSLNGSSRGCNAACRQYKRCPKLPLSQFPSLG